MKKTIVFRVGEFPKKSETFITQQAIIAIRLGYNISLLVDKKNSVENSSQKELILKYELLNKTFELKPIVPKSKMARIITIIKIAFSGVSFEVLSTLNFFKHGKKGLRGKYLFQFFEIKNFVEASIVHLQFGVNKYPFDELKQLGIYKGKLITSFHGFDVHYTSKNFKNRSRYYSTLFKSGDAFTSNTEYLAEQLLQLGCPRNRLEIIPMPVDTDYFKPPHKVNNNLKKIVKLISVGRLIQLKGHRLGIRAIGELVKEGITNISYTIIGDGPEWQHLEQLIVSLKLENYVFLLGAKTQEEIKIALQNSNVFLMTSTFDENGRREAQGIVTGEAQACGLSVVAFRSGGVPYTIEEGATGFLSEENDYFGLKNNLKKLVKDETLILEMGKNAREFIEQKYSLEIVTDIWKVKYANLI